MQNSVAQWTYHVTETEAVPERIDKYLSAKMEADQGVWDGGEKVGCSRTRIQSLLKENQIFLNGKILSEKDSKKTILKTGDRIQIHLPLPRPISLDPEDIPLEILFQDEHIVVVNKPPGLTVHPSETQTHHTLVHALLHHIKDLSGIGGELRPGIVHRLDKNTSGALVVSKSDLAHQRLVEIFSKHAIERRYWAVCYGSPNLQSRIETKIETLIDRNPKDRKKMSSDVKTGRNAITWVQKKREYFNVLSKPAFASLIEARLETGRTHQVRVHLTGLGNSILGDPSYGTPTPTQSKWRALPASIQEIVGQLPGQALHARVLGFHHPITQEWMLFEAAPPPTFSLLLEALEEKYGS